MAHLTAIPAVSQSTKARSDWLTLLTSAFINGLKAYGAALMVAVPDPSHVRIGDTVTELSKPAFRKQPVVATQATPVVPHAPLAKPAWSRA